MTISFKLQESEKENANEDRMTSILLRRLLPG